VHDDPPCMRNYILLYCALLGGARGRAVGGGRSFAGTTRSTDDDGWGMSHQVVVCSYRRVRRVFKFLAVSGAGFVYFFFYATVTLDPPCARERTRH